jgi:DNA polymerase-3 subunit chi
VTTIDFYFNAADPLQVACRLAAKVLGQKKRMLVHAPEAELAARIDRMLWTWPAIGFVPHCAARDPLAADTPVLIGSGEDGGDGESAAGCQVLLNLGLQCPPDFERFERLLEVVGAGEQERSAGRERYRFYLERGYKIANHDLAKAGEAEASQRNE